jgi:hypothetical protein
MPGLILIGNLIAPGRRHGPGGGGFSLLLEPDWIGDMLRVCNEFCRIHPVYVEGQEQGAR